MISGKMNHEEYTEWCEKRGLYPPKKCKCGNSYHYVCAECEPEFFDPERLSERTSKEDATV